MLLPVGGCLCIPLPLLLLLLLLLLLVPRNSDILFHSPLDMAFVFCRFRLDDEDDDTFQLLRSWIDAVAEDTSSFIGFGPGSVTSKRSLEYD